MPIPTFNGSPIFGAASVIIPTPHEPRWQVSAYNGVNGRDATFLGHSGGFSPCDFHILAPSLEALAVLEATWIILKTNGTLGVLIDTLGRSWPDVLVRQFIPNGKVENYGPAGFGRNYFALLEHLL